MTSLIRIVLFLQQSICSPACSVTDWALDNVRDNGAESVGVSCDESDGMPEMFLLVGPDWQIDRIK